MPPERTLGWVQDAYDLQKIILVPMVLEQGERITYTELANRLHDNLGIGVGHRWPWAVDGFIRAAHSLQLIAHFREDDSFAQTDLARRILARIRRRRRTLDGVEIPEPEPRRIDEFRQAMLMNPHVVRLLILLDGNPEGLTKYEIGERFGFVGEAGFSHITQELRIRSGDPNAEGSADKYARTYYRWLEQMGWAESRLKSITVNDDTRQYQAYFLTYAGRQARRRSEGLTKYIIYEALGSRKNPFWDRMRRIRATLINILAPRTPLPIETIRTQISDRLNENFSGIRGK